MQADSQALDLEVAVRERYSAGAQARQPELCCPVQYNVELQMLRPTAAVPTNPAVDYPSVLLWNHQMLIMKITKIDVTATPSELQNVWVVIPVRNEKESLPLVLQELPEVGRVIVADNGSTDGSGKLAVDSGAWVVVEPQPGYGKACLAALGEIDRMIRKGERDPEVVVFIDGDYSDYPEYLTTLVEPILDGTHDFVLGSRLMGVREPGAMPPQSIYGNMLACGLMRLFWRVRYSDLGPFRAISWRALQSLRMEDENFGWTVEMQIKAAIAKLRILELPVPYRKRIGVSRI